MRVVEAIHPELDSKLERITSQPSVLSSLQPRLWSVVKHGCVCENPSGFRTSVERFRASCHQSIPKISKLEFHKTVLIQNVRMPVKFKIISWISDTENVSKKVSEGILGMHHVRQNRE